MNRKSNSRRRGKRYALVLAAGRSLRFQSRVPKVVHPLCGKPLIRHILETLVKLDLERIFMVVGHRNELVTEAVSGFPVTFSLQRNPLGTGHAVMAAAPHLKNLSGSLLVLSGDTPLITSRTLRRLLTAREKHDADQIVLTAHLEEPRGYGRIVRDMGGDPAGIVEEKDATRAQKKIREVNTGFYCFKVPSLLEELGTLSRTNAAREYYLTDLLRIFHEAGRSVAALPTDSVWEVRGINDREELARAEHWLRGEIAAGWMRKGVSILNPSTVYIDASVVLKPDTTIHAGALIEGRSRIGSGCVIGRSCHLRNARLGDNVHLDHCSIVRDSRVPSGTRLGPFSYLKNNRLVDRRFEEGENPTGGSP